MPQNNIEFILNSNRMQLLNLQKQSMTNVCVYGAGAVGGYLATRLASAGTCSVSVLARGKHLDAIREFGLRLETPEQSIFVAPTFATDDSNDLPPQDLVFVTLKANDLPNAATSIARLLKPDGVAIFATNGVPWWWNYGSGNNGGPLKLLDPCGALWHELTPARVLGCVVYSMNQVIAPGVIKHYGNNRWLIGEPSGGSSSRLERVVKLLETSQVNAQSIPDLRLEIWSKLLKNAPLNPVCALTRLDTDQVANSPDLLMIVDAIAGEVAATATAMGLDVSLYADAARKTLLTGGALPGQRARGVKPSMLQDVLAGKQMETEAIVGQVRQFAREAGISTPALDTMVTLLRCLALATTATR